MRINLIEDPLPEGGCWHIPEKGKHHLETLRHWQLKRADQARYQRGYRLISGLWVHKDRSMAEQRAFDAGLLD